MIRKRLLSACLALALCLSLLPVTALADGVNAPNTLYVGGTLVSSNSDGGYWTTDAQGKLTKSTANDNWNVKYEPSTATLTLRRATIQRGTSTGSVPYGAGIYAQGSSNQPVTLTIELIGENTITGTFGIYVNAEINASSYGTNATLTIMGDNNGSLEVSGSNNGIYVKSGTGNASLNIKNVAVTSSTNDNYAAGVYVMSSNYATNSPNISLSVDGGSLTASGTGSRDGILFYVGSSQATGATTSLTVSENAIVDARNGGISALKISETLPTPTPTGDNRSGIVFDGSTGTVYGSVALQDDLTIGEGESLTIPDGASLTIGNDATLTNEGTVTNSGTLTNSGTIDNYGTLTGTISGNAPPSITTTSLAGGAVGTAYSSVTLSATGSPTSWAWSAAAGSNTPPGLTLNTDTGEISGTPTATGTSTFTVKASNAYGSDSKEFTLTINPAPVLVNSVTLNKSETTLTVGGTDTLTATITPTNATNQNVTWSSDNESIATVSNGVVTAVAPGTATITVTTADGNYTAVCTVYVTPYIPPVPSYLIQLPEVEGGTVTADRATARQGTEVALTVTPDEGFALASLAVTDFFGNQVDISRNSDGTYSFVMPASQVTVSAAFAPAQLPFTDVTEANWYYDEVYYVWANGLMQGTSAATFGPNVDTTRAMVVTILWRLEGEPASGYDMDYSDVAGGAWYAGAVRWATEHGIVNGSEGQFYPGGIVTREQLAAMLYRYAQYKGYDLTAGGDLSGFADAGAVSGWAETSLAWAVGQRLIQGSANQIDPTGSAIRAQVAAILMRFCENTAN